MDGSETTTRRRHPLQGGYARGEETRDRIIEAAFSVFADEGYSGASTRRIAAKAGVNPPALQYYFDSKEGLHRACGQAIVDPVAEELSPAFERAADALADGTHENVVRALCDLVEKLALLAIAKAEAETWTRFLNRCQADNAGPAAEVIQTGIVDPLRQLVTQLIASALALPDGAPQARLRALLLLSQISAFHSNRASTLSTLGWSDFSGENLTLALQVLRDHTKRIATCEPARA